MNRFRDPSMRQNYDAAVRAFETKHRDLFVNGERRRPLIGLGGAKGAGYGSSFAEWFWKGYDGARLMQGSEKLVGYAFYRAGMDCAKASKVAA